MTFTEAAVEVLRSVGKPLHYKKITEIAIERNLLSHVGKTPETTMSSRLATMVKKDRGDAPIVKVKPGVFALRDSAEEAAEEVASESEKQDSEVAEAGESGTDAPAEAADSAPEQAEQEPSIAAKELPGADVFPEEDDDDELILANLDEEKSEGRRTRKRRPRRRRDRDGDAGSSAESRTEGRAERSERSERRSSSSRSRTRKAPEAPAHRAAEAGEPLGRDLADAIETSLRSRGRQAKSLLKVAESLIDSGRLAGSAATLAPTLSAAIRGDNAKRRSTGGRPRFREGDGQVALLEWELPADAVNAERDALRAADRQRHGVRRALIKRLKDLPDGALLELLAAWLNAVGVHSLRAVRAEVGEFNLAGTLRRGPEETPLAISISKGRKSVDKDAVIALRGGLHNFEHARIAWLITLGKVNEEARAEAQAEAAVPCAVFDGDAIAASMEEVGIAIQRVSLPLAVLDVDLLDSLGGGETRSAQRDKSDDEADSNGSKRRRGRRRGRRRSEREEGNEDSSQDASATSTRDSEVAEAGESAPESADEPPQTEPEPTEDTKKTPAEAAPEPAPEPDPV